MSYAIVDSSSWEVEITICSDITTVAKMLKKHPNTLRYRFREKPLSIKIDDRTVVTRNVNIVKSNRGKKI